MKIIYIGILSLSVFLLVGCSNAGSSPALSPQEPQQKAYDLSKGFPDGAWTGSGYSQEVGKEMVRTDVSVNIASNEFFTETNYASGIHQDAVDKFVFTSEGRADWIGLDDSKIGSCSCSKFQCGCVSELNGIKIDRMIAFSKTGIHIEESSTFNGKTYNSACDLRAR